MVPSFQVEGVLLVAPNAASLSHRRKEFLRAMKESLVVKHDQRATSHRIASSLEQVKVSADRQKGNATINQRRKRRPMKSILHEL